MKKLILFTVILFTTSLLAGNYVQVGDQYSKISYKKVYATSSNQHILNLIDNTVLINSKRASGVNRGSGFYLGLHKGEHLFMTNSHVMNKSECKASAKVSFLKEDMSVGSGTCNRVLLILTKNEKSDLTLFTVRNGSVDKIKGRGLEIDFNFRPIAGRLLAQNGFGLKNAVRGTNADRKLKKFNANVSMDSDCAISSNALANMSARNVDNSIATGCDMAGGDSGSALIDRETGKVVGLIWGNGVNLKNQNRISSNTFWNLIVGSRDIRIWQNMSYAISLASLKSKLKTFLD